MESSVNGQERQHDHQILSYYGVTPKAFLIEEFFKKREERTLYQGKLVVYDNDGRIHFALRGNAADFVANEQTWWPQSSCIYNNQSALCRFNLDIDLCSYLMNFPLHIRCFRFETDVDATYSFESKVLPFVFSWEEADIVVKDNDEGLYLEFSGNNAKMLFQQGKNLNGVSREETIIFATPKKDIMRNQYTTLFNTFFCYKRTLNEQTEGYYCHANLKE